MMCCSKRCCCLLASAALALVCVPHAQAHATAGQRLFPSTLTFDDPGIGAEMPFVFSTVRDHGVTQSDLSWGLTKPVTSRFSLTAATDYLGTHGRDTPTAHGFSNFSLGAVWQAWRDADGESIGSLSINRSFAHTGSRAMRDNFATWSPELDFGKGLGNVRASWLRPAAITGALAVNLPDNAAQPRSLDWAVSLQYSLPYLEDFVRYTGLKAPLKNLIPVIEFPMHTCLDRGCAGQTTGYVAPGAIWVGRHVQWGLELQIPINHRSGHTVGVMFGLDLYLDDLLPHSFGAPLFR